MRSANSPYVARPEHGAELAELHQVRSRQDQHDGSTIRDDNDRLRDLAAGHVLALRHRLG
jgi:hypothetical protein